MGYTKKGHLALRISSGEFLKYLDVSAGEPKISWTNNYEEAMTFFSINSAKPIQTILEDIGEDLDPTIVELDLIIE
jgi:hypothetical protein